MQSDAPSTSSQDENPATMQILVLLATVFLLGMLIIPENKTSVAPTPPDAEQDMISNPQIADTETSRNQQVAPGMPVAMFNLENPNGWETPETVTLVGTLQDELGCEADLIIDCDMTNMTYDVLGDIWQASYQLPSGEYEYRVVLDHTDNRIYGQHGISGNNSDPIHLILDEQQTVNFYYDHKTGWITDNINSLILTLPGNFQDEVGCREEWNAGCFRTWMQDLEGDGLYTYETLHIPQGSWETRVALNANLDTSYGQGGILEGDNIPLWIPNIGHLTVFTWDSNLKTLTIFVSNVPIRLSTELPPIAPNE